MPGTGSAVTPAAVQAAVHLFDVQPALAYRPRKFRSLGSKNFAGENPPYGASIYYHLKTTSTETPALTITDADGKKIAEIKGGKEAGLHRLQWNLQLSPQGKGGAFLFRPVPAGEYSATLRVGEHNLRKQIVVEWEEQRERIRSARQYELRDAELNSSSK